MTHVASGMNSGVTGAIYADQADIISRVAASSRKVSSLHVIRWHPKGNVGETFRASFYQVLYIEERV